jgi:ubiquinone/menaquinone biosynthesis C-methylase UbiE
MESVEMIAPEDAPVRGGQPSPDGRPPLADQTRHLHCGYWEAPARADRADEEFALATEEMCRRLFRAAAVADGMRILDAGCGTGGTLEALDDAFGSLSLTGLNIDPRELAAARRRLRGRGRPGGDVELIEGDACAMPLPDGGFDLVLAIESILLFPSRRRFLSEARRVLRPGGRLLVVDFVPALALRAWLAAWGGSLGRLRGPRGPRTDVRISLPAYRRLAAATGFRLESAADWTRQTLPSYRAGRRIVRRLAGRGFNARGLLSNTLTEWLSRAGLLRYQVLLFQDLREPPP